MIHLVLLPGLDGTGSLFAPFLKALPRELAVSVISYPTDLPLDYSALEDFAARRLPPAGQLILLGESFSGPIAIAMAARLPDRVCGLILCCSFALNPRPALAVLAPFVALARSLRLPFGPTTRLLLGASAPDEVRELLIESVARVTPAVLHGRLSSIIAVDVRAALRSITVPVRYLQADADRLVPATAARIAKQVCAQMQLVSIKGPHALLQDSPIPSASAVAAFVGEIENTLGTRQKAR